MESEGEHEEGRRVEECMRRSGGVHEEGRRVKESMRRSEGVHEESEAYWSVFPHDQNCCYDTAGGLDL